MHAADAAAVSEMLAVNPTYSTAMVPSNRNVLVLFPSPSYIYINTYTNARDDSNWTVLMTSSSMEHGIVMFEAPFSED